MFGRIPEIHVDRGLATEIGERRQVEGTLIDIALFSEDSMFGEIPEVHVDRGLAAERRGEGES